MFYASLGKWRGSGPGAPIHETLLCLPNRPQSIKVLAIVGSELSQRPSSRVKWSASQHSLGRIDDSDLLTVCTHQCHRRLMMYGCLDPVRPCEFN